MKRTMLIVAVAALCVAGSAMAEDRGGLIGSGTRTDDNATGQTMGSGGFTTPSTQASGQMVGSGGRTEETGQLLGSTGGRAGYFGSGLAVYELRLFDLNLLVVSSDEGTFVIPIGK